MNRCPNCQQPLLPDDVVCWQCGTRLEPAAEPEVETTIQDQWVSEGGGLLTDKAGNTQVTVVYTALTAGIMALLLLVIWQLQRAPLSQVSFRDAIPIGYQVAVDQQTRITFDMPRSWQGLDPLVAEERSILDGYLTSQDKVFSEAIQPWEDLLGSLDLMYLAVPEAKFEAGQSAFVIVLGSQDLANLSEEVLQTLVTQADWLTVRQMMYVEDSDKSHLRLDFVTFPLDAERQAVFSGFVYLCSQQIVSGREQGVILAVCIPQRTSQSSLEVRNAQALRDNVLESFQYLRK
ncbi:MAG: zinc ribbon domain-containing protein [Ardenticatenaceae bacterium]|nr:zinc ribbon domain-containing protein [Ardenticatenaceae bacterium]